MTSQGWRAALGVGVCALSLLVSGCGGGETDAGPDGGSLGPGPLAEFLGWSGDYAASDEISEAEHRRQYRVEELVADCMAEAGFEYLPQRRDDQIGEVSDEYVEATALRTEDPERFASEYGYGMTTMPPGRSSAQDYEDPNWAIREGLSPQDQTEYDRALWGEWPEATLTDEAIEPAHPGCYSEATEEVYGAADDGGYEQWEEINQQIGELYEQIERHPRVAEAVRDWGGCMTEAGYPGLDKIYGGHELVNERSAQVHGWGADSAGESPEPDPGALADLQDFERAVASTDYQCRREHYDTVYGEVRDELEGQFIEDHRAELEAYRDWLASAPGRAGG